MEEFLNKTALKEYFVKNRATCDNLRYEPLDLQMALNSYLLDYNGDPKASGLLAFCVKEGLPACAMALVECGADVNDTFNNRSALYYLHRLNPKEFYDTTQANLKRLERILVKHGAQDFVKQSTPVRVGRLQRSGR